MSQRRDGVEIFFEAEGVVDDDFAGEEYGGERVAELPGLDGVSDGGGKFFAGIEVGELDLGVVAVGGGGFGAFDPGFTRGDLLERECDRLKLASDWAGDRLSWQIRSTRSTSLATSWP